MTPTLIDDALHLRVLTAQVIDIHRTWNTQDVCSPYWRFYVNNIDGAELVLAKGVRHRLTAQHLHLVPAWVPFSCHNTVAIDHLYIHFEVCGIPGAVVREVFPRPIAVRLDPSMQRACSHLHDTIHESQNAPATHLCQVKSVLYSALAQVFAGLSAKNVHSCYGDRSARAIIAPALTLIADRYHETLGNVALAKACQLSPDHLIRLFRSIIGQTPAQYVQEQRLAAAAQRLLFSSESIERIAEDCGFGDRFYFTRAFRRRMGLPPAAFRLRGHI